MTQWTQHLLFLMSKINIYFYFWYRAANIRSPSAGTRKACSCFLSHWQLSSGSGGIPTQGSAECPAMRPCCCPQQWEEASPGMRWGWGCGEASTARSSGTHCTVQHSLALSQAATQQLWTLPVVSAWEPFQDILLLRYGHLSSCTSDSVALNHVRHSVGSGWLAEGFANVVALSYKEISAGCILPQGQRLPVCHHAQELGRSSRSCRMWK